MNQPLSISAAKAPYITFEYRAVEDRAATMTSGRYSSRDVAFAIVTPAGSKDRYEREVADWFANLEQQVREQRFPQEWLQNYKRQFEAWKAGEEIPLEGMPIKNWGLLSPSQRENCLRWNIVTVEALAVANEETISRLGMGGRELVQRAKDFIAAQEPGKVTATIEALRATNVALLVANKSLEDQVQMLTMQLQDMRHRAPAVTEHQPQDSSMEKGDPPSFAKF